MQQEEKPLSKEQLFKQVTENIEPDAALVEDLDKVLEGMEYKERVDESGESAPETQMFLVEHPEAKSNLQFAKHIYSKF